MLLRYDETWDRLLNHYEEMCCKVLYLSFVEMYFTVIIILYQSVFVFFYRFMWDSKIVLYSTHHYTISTYCKFLNNVIYIYLYVKSVIVEIYGKKNTSAHLAMFKLSNTDRAIEPVNVSLLIWDLDVCFT